MAEMSLTQVLVGLTVRSFDAVAQLIASRYGREEPSPEEVCELSLKLGVTGFWLQPVQIGQNVQLVTPKHHILEHGEIDVMNTGDGISALLIPAEAIPERIFRAGGARMDRVKRLAEQLPPFFDPFGLKLVPGRMHFTCRIRDLEYSTLSEIGLHQVMMLFRFNPGREDPIRLLQVAVFFYDSRGELTQYLFD